MFPLSEDRICHFSRIRKTVKTDNFCDRLQTVATPGFPQCFQRESDSPLKSSPRQIPVREWAALGSPLARSDSRVARPPGSGLSTWPEFPYLDSGLDSVLDSSLLRMRRSSMKLNAVIVHNTDATQIIFLIQSDLDLASVDALFG